MRAPQCSLCIAGSSGSSSTNVLAENSLLWGPCLADQCNNGRSNSSRPAPSSWGPFLAGRCRRGPPPAPDSWGRLHTHRKSPSVPFSTIQYHLVSFSTMCHSVPLAALVMDVGVGWGQPQSEHRVGGSSSYLTCVIAELSAMSRIRHDLVHTWLHTAAGPSCSSAVW